MTPRRLTRQRRCAACGLPSAEPPNVLCPACLYKLHEHLAELRNGTVGITRQIVGDALEAFQSSFAQRADAGVGDRIGVALEEALVVAIQQTRAHIVERLEREGLADAAAVARDCAFVGAVRVHVDSALATAPGDE